MTPIITVLHEMAARHFVRAKGRMPIDSNELIAWLMEFTEVTGDLLTRTQQAYLDHLTVCNRPILFNDTKDKKTS